MKSSKRGVNISVNVENITPFGLWLFVNGHEYFLSYQDYPYFKEKTIKEIRNVEMLHGHHLYWPDFDVDLEIDNLKNPEKYPLKSKIMKSASSQNPTRRIAHA
jgi:hypothetical protein